MIISKVTPFETVGDVEVRRACLLGDLNESADALVVNTSEVDLRKDLDN